jgi:serpin B
VPFEPTALEKQLIESDNKFGLKLFRTVAAEEPGNVFVSPLSVSMALGMTLNGAAGDTRTDMEETLELAGLSVDEINESYQSMMDALLQADPKVAFQIANSIWYRQGLNFKQSFIETNKTFFDAEVAGLDFNSPQAVDTINDWVSDKTNKRIEEIIDAIPQGAIMYLINAIYFKGNWSQKFDRSGTSVQPFHLAGGGTKSVDMMREQHTFSYTNNSSFQAIELAYGDSVFRAVVILPHQTASMDSLVSELTDGAWHEWSKDFHANAREVDFSLPKFTLKYEVELNDALSALGMRIAFTPFQADFSNLYDERSDVYISKVKHKTFLQVDEAGTEAAAVTSVEIGVTSIGPSQPVVMKVDRPFLFFIHEKNSGLILFVGKVMEPES